MPVTVLDPGATPSLRLFQHPNPAAALGLAVSHLMTRPAFARLQFGSWSRVLVGQINRKHYYLALDPAGRTVGLLGWAITDQTGAEAWLAGSAEPGAHAPHDDCMVINAWSAETPAASRLLLDAARGVGAPHRLIYFKRHYPDGTTRNGKMAVPDFVQSKLQTPLRHVTARNIA